MNNKILATLVLSTLVFAACAPIPATGGSPAVSDLSADEFAQPFDPYFDYVPPNGGYPLNPDLANEALPATGGSPALVGSASDISLSDEALELAGEGISSINLFLPSGDDKSLSDEAMELEGS